MTKNANSSNFDKLYIGKSKFHKDLFTMVDGVLLMKSKGKSPLGSEEKLKIVIPSKLVSILLHTYHCKSKGHMSRDELNRQITRKYVIDEAWSKVSRYSCEVCNANTRVNKTKVPIEKYPQAVSVFEQVYFDILGPLPLTRGGKRYVIAFIDRFSRYCVLDSLKDRTAISVADSIVSKIICTFNGVRCLISDNAAEFCGQILKELCKKFQIKKCNITAYCPWANGLVKI